ncbi:CRAL-TRIO domain-containing protein [Hysterangium stoloniferum]|nr:CRAL-TRIO domain-containing protein [Hysterangium stoloniferum]
MPPNPPPQVQDPSKPLPGRLGNLSIPQQHTLEKFKKELQNEGFFVPERHDDATLLRFLRARQFDLVKAKEMIIAAEKWRKELDVDNIARFDYSEQPEVDKYYPQYYHSVDKDGRPVYIERLGKLDIKALYNITTQERQLKHLVQEYEKMIIQRFPACSAKVGHPVETSCTILDLHNVGIGQFYRVKDYVLAASQIGQNYYPETMGKFYICNAPYLFTTVWSIIKPWLDPVTVSKIAILGKDYKQELLAQIPAENLPRELGGTCECVGGCSMSDKGPWNESGIKAKAGGNGTMVEAGTEG